METTTPATEPPITSQQARDFGEPWREQTISFMPGTIEDRDGKVVNTREQKLRAIDCVAACAGMADPAKEIQAMRDAIGEAFAALDSDALWAFNTTPPKELEARWHDGKGSLTSGPNNCLAFFERRKSALTKLQPHLPAK